MTHPQESAALTCQRASATTDQPPNPTHPGDMLEVLALVGVLRFTKAASLAKRLGGSLLWRDPAGAFLAAPVCDGQALDLRAVDQVRIRHWACWVESLTSPNSAEWARDLVRRLASERATDILPPTLRWGADALTHGWRTLGEVRRVVIRTLDQAEGRGEAA